jgi:UDP-N-acetylmuramoyl-L-alanyl-D-glutamate--2,6-diaminopimelate ligase
MSAITLSAHELAALLQNQKLLLASHLSKELHSRRFGLEHFVSDSRRVRPGDCFIAYKGAHADSHGFLEEVEKKGALLLLVEQDLSPQRAAGGISWLKVSSSRAAMAWLYAALYGHPESSFKFFGVTGTNGKTSTVWLTKALLAHSNIKSLSCGTLGYYLGDEHSPSPHTTPDPEALFPMLQQARNKNIPAVLMEVSSHSLVQEKLLPVKFSAAGFTSFTRDHLDFHGDLEAYWQAKWQLFSSYLVPGGKAFIHGNMLPQVLKETTANIDIYFYGHNLRDLTWPKEKIIALTIEGESKQGSTIQFSFAGKSYRGTIPLWGIYNCENFLCAWLLAYCYSGMGVEADSWERIPGVPGRLQRVRKKGSTGAEVYIDYAHTPDALLQAITVTRRHCSGQLWVLFGCGGDRDHGKRKIMGKIAHEHADIAIVTADNPRSEKIEDINAEICSGFPPAAQPLVITDRREAIRYALRQAQAGDVVLIAGKGHETTQVIGKQVFAFDDYKVALEFLPSSS